MHSIHYSTLKHQLHGLESQTSQTKKISYGYANTKLGSFVLFLCWLISYTPFSEEFWNDKYSHQLGIVAHIFNSRTWKAKEERYLWVPGKPGLPRQD